MEVREKLLKFKYHVVFAIAFALLAFVLVAFSPSLLNVFSYFWPLLLSTSLFLSAVLFFGRTSSLTDAEGSGVKGAAEGLLDYVAGQTDMTADGLKLE